MKTKRGSLFLILLALTPLLFFFHQNERVKIKKTRRETLVIDSKGTMEKKLFFPHATGMNETHLSAKKSTIEIQFQNKALTLCKELLSDFECISKEEQKTRRLLAPTGTFDFLKETFFADAATIQLLDESGSTIDGNAKEIEIDFHQDPPTLRANFLTLETS